MTREAYRVRQGDTVLYLMPYADADGRVLYRQDAATFDTSRETVSREQARTLAERGRPVPVGVTPAWADPQAPRADSASLDEQANA